MGGMVAHIRLRAKRGGRAKQELVSQLLYPGTLESAHTIK